MVKPYSFPNVRKVWAPDHIVGQLTGQFAEYSTFPSIPREMRAAPDATTWAGVELWLYWSDPQSDKLKGRVFPRERQKIIWTVMLCTERWDILSPEMLMLIFTFVRY